MVSCAGEKMAVVFGRFWKDPIRRKRKRRQCLDYNPLWLERQKMTSPRMGGMEGGMKR